MEATTPELGPVGLCIPKSTTFSDSDAIVVEETARNFLSPRLSINKSEQSKLLDQKHEVEASKLHR